MDKGESSERAEETTNTFTVFLGSIASISLLVGGIGIINITLVSVTGRTRETGVGKAMGAKRRDILFQFVTEASLLSLGGQAVRVVGGYASSRALDGREPIGQKFQTVFSPEIAVLALAASAAHRTVLRHLLCNAGSSTGSLHMRRQPTRIIPSSRAGVERLRPPPAEVHHPNRPGLEWANVS